MKQAMKKNLSFKQPQASLFEPIAKFRAKDDSMLRSSMVRSNPDVERAVNELLAADANFDRNENRSVHREHLVRHLLLEIRQPEQSIEGFSRNISTAGIGIITDQEIVVGVIGEMEIERLKGPAVKIVAECRWCRSYGENWFISGWQFQSLKR